MKDYNREINYKSFNEFADVAVNNSYEVEIVEGVLNDTYVIFNRDKQLYIKGVKPRDFIVLYPQFQNEWNNSFHILMTDDEKKVEQFLETEEV